MLPLRWYLQILFDQAARGLPASNSVRPFVILAGLACLYFALAWARLSAIANAPPKREAEPVSASDTDEASPSQWATRSSEFSATAGSWA